MQPLEQVNKEISFYRNNDYKWVRELTTLFEDYFDKKFREFLSYEYSANMQETEIRQLFVSGLDTLYRIIVDGNYFEEKDISFGSAFSSSIAYAHHPVRNEESVIDKSKVNKLFGQVTMPWIIFELNISEHLQNYYKAKAGNKKLDPDKRSNEIKIAKLEAIAETIQKNYDKIVEDIQEEKRKSIEGMIRSYINTCDILDTADPKRPQLSELSGVSDRFWKSTLANSSFLYSLSIALTSKKKQSKEKKELWLEAFQKNEERLSNALYDAKKKAEYSDHVDYVNPKSLSKQTKIKGQEIKSRKDGGEQSPYKIKECKTCGKVIKFGTECPDCRKEFKTIKNTSNSKKTKKEIETDERFKKTMEKLKAQKK